MRALRTVVALITLLLIAGPPVVASDRPVLRGTVVGVIDGDTADIRLESGMIRIRFHAIDAPESGQPHGKAAKAALSQLIFGKAVEVEPFEQDRYDRMVAAPVADGQDVNATMIKTGNAWTYRRFADEPRIARMSRRREIRDGDCGACHPPIGWRRGNGGNASRARAALPTTPRKPLPRVLRHSVAEPAQSQPLGFNANSISSGANPATRDPHAVASR